MHILSKLFLGAFLVCSASVLAEPVNCPCTDCKCTEENHCGCFSDEGCKCMSETSCCGEACECEKCACNE